MDIHSSHVKAAIIALDKGETMKSIKATLSGYRKPTEGHRYADICAAWCGADDATRKPAFRGYLCDLHYLLGQREDMPATPAPEFSRADIEQHHSHARWLRGQLIAHGIDSQDFPAVLAWLEGNGNILPRYWISIYVDYVYSPELQPGLSYAALERKILSTPDDWAKAYGRGKRASVTPQAAKAHKSRDHLNCGKVNRLPRGKCAERMQALGWFFYTN